MIWQRRANEWLATNGRTIDIGLFGLVLVGGVLGALLIPVEGSERSADWLAMLLVVGASVPVLWRRAAPRIGLPVATAFVVPYWVLDYPGAVDVVLWLLFYAATRHGGADRRRVWQVVGLCLAVILGIAIVGVIVPTEDLPWVAIVGIFIIHGMAAVVGEALYQRSQYVAELEQRAAALEADRRFQTTLAAAEERSRIAREIHDIIAHGMSSIVVQAQGAQRLVDHDPDRAREVLSTIEAIGRNSVDEMRRLLGVLRDDEAEAALSPQPGLHQLGELARHAEDAGIELAIDVRGQQRPLPPGLDLTSYRVVQEALTNVMRHAGRPARADVVIVYGVDAIDIDVVDDGLGAAASPSTAGSGHGLVGMRERVEIYDGVLDAAPRAGGGYRVHASLPIPAAARVDA